MHRRLLLLALAPLLLLSQPSLAATALEQARRCIELVNARSDLPQAVTLCTRAIGSRVFKGRQLVPLYYNRGWALDELGDYPAAIEDYTRAVEIQPDFLAAYVARGYTQMRQGALTKAVDDFSLVLRVDPEVFEALHNRALAYERLGERDLALADYRKAAALRPDDPHLKRILEQLESQAQSPGK